MRIAAEAQIGDVHSVRVRGVQGIEDVLAAGVIDRAGEDVVAAQEGRRSNARDRVGDHDAVDRGGGAEVAGHRAGDVRAVVLDGLRVEAEAGRLVGEHLRDDDLVVRVVVRPVLIAHVVEARVVLLNSGVDDRDLDSSSCALGAARTPRLHRVDQGEVGVDPVGRVVQPAVFGRDDLRRGAQHIERRAVERDRYRIERHIERAGDLRLRSVGLQPLLELVALRRQSRAVGLRLGAVEIRALALAVDGRRRRDRSALQLDQRCRRIGGRRLSRVAVGGRRSHGRYRRHDRDERGGYCQGDDVPPSERCHSGGDPFWGRAPQSRGRGGKRSVKYCRCAGRWQGST